MPRLKSLHPFKKSKNANSYAAHPTLSAISISPEHSSKASRPLHPEKVTKMSRMMGFSSFFKTRATRYKPKSPSSPSTSSSSSISPSRWTWPSCKTPTTQSFRADDDLEETYKHMVSNPVYMDYHSSEESWFSESQVEDDSDGFSTISSDGETSDVDAVIDELHLSDRLVLESVDGCRSSSILEELKAGEELGFMKESVVMAVESEDPYIDFRKSMEDMVVEHGLMEWEYLEKLLEWYLKVNEEKSHGVIRQAFVDLTVELVSSAVSSSSSSSSSS